MSSKLEIRKLREVIDLVIDNRGKNPKEYSAAGIPVIDNYLITSDGEVNLNEVNRFIDENTYSSFLRKYLQFGDVLMTLVGNGYGKVAITPKDKCAIIQNTVGFRCNNDNSNQFLYYLLRSNREIFMNLNRGAAQPSIKVGDILDLEFQFPSKENQERIAALLGALDDRIALLRETNATLEAIAQALFKSWFVDFDPVHARAKAALSPCSPPTGERDLPPLPAGEGWGEGEGLPEPLAALFPDSFEESPLGLVPRGWRVTSLKEAVGIYDSKRVPLSGAERAAKKGEYPYYGAAALMDHVNDYLFDGVYLLLGEDGSVTDPDGYPVTQYVWGKIWVNNHAHVLQGANGISTEHLMLAIKRINIQPYVTGAVQAKLSQGNMWRIPFLMPEREIAEAFGELIAPLFVRYRHNAEQAQTLAALRNTLLPRLISGQLRLPEVAAMLEETVA